MRYAWGVLGLAVVASAGAACVAQEAVIARKPTAVKTGEGVRIDFAVSRPTDVAVSIEDAQGKIVRHLAAGVLGPNAPAPLKPNSLEQSLVWDGKDDAGVRRWVAGGSLPNQPAATSNLTPTTQYPPPVRVRVSLGLGAAFDKVLLSDPYNIGGVQNLAVGPDGTAYVMIGAGGSLWKGQQMVAFNREGTYQRMVMPFPANLKAKDVEGLETVQLDGRPAPLVHGLARYGTGETSAYDFYGSSTVRRAGMAVTPGGQVLTLPTSGGLGALSERGGTPWGKYLGPRLSAGQGGGGFTGRPFIATSADGKRAYLSGLTGADRKAAPAVFRVPLPERTPATLFFGDLKETGKDEAHLGGPPAGLAVDGRGRVLIVDPANNRLVCVAEADGKFVGAMPVEKPESIAVDPKTGAVYVLRQSEKGAVELAKFSKVEFGREVTPTATLPLSGAGRSEAAWHLALDAGVEPPIVWLGGERGGLLRVEDNGRAFGEPKRLNTSTVGNAAFVDATVDRFRNEIYVRGGIEPYWWFRFNEATGEMAKIRPEPLPTNSGSALTVGLDGSLYLPGWPDNLMRFTRDGKAAPWEIAQKGYPVDRKIEGRVAIPPAHGRFVPTSMTYTTHTVGVRRDGHIFVFEPDAPGGRPPKMLIEYLPTGERKPTPIIWKVSDTAVGPKFDLAGNIYVAEQVKEPERPVPADFKGLVGEVKVGARVEDTVKDGLLTMYGSILKFTPKGGMVNFPATPRGNTSQTRMDPTGANPFDGEPQLDPSLKTQPVTSFRQGRLSALTVTGAEWVRTGISHVGFESCNCENTRFDVDDFGRVFYPDLGRFRVCVLDTNGNAITEFGGYGNAESAGPEIAFAWLIGVAATDRYAYMGDSLARRFLRVKLTYRSEETCALP
jgi:hypothetical protein